MNAFAISIANGIKMNQMLRYEVMKVGGISILSIFAMGCYVVHRKALGTFNKLVLWIAGVVSLSWWSRRALDNEKSRADVCSDGRVAEERVLMQRSVAISL